MVIPCLNEAETISRAVKDAIAGIRAAGSSGEVIVADNGSSDGSRGLAAAAGARVVPVPLRGYGAALDAGIRSARYSCVVFADADLSYPFENIPVLVPPLRNGNTDFVLGSRLRGTIEKKAMPLLNRRLGTPVLSFLIRFLYGLPTSDCNSGMRAMLTSKYRELNLLCPGMEYASEMLIRAGQKGFRYREVPIAFRKDQRNRPPHLRRWRDGWRHLRFILGNASATATVLFPLLLSILFLAIPLVLSIRPMWAPEDPVRYHSAFLSIAIAIPFLMFAMSSILVKTALHESGQVPSRLISAARDLGENGAPFYISLFLYGLVFCQAAYMLWEWRQAGWGELSDIGGVIRVIVLAVAATALFSLDLSYGILKLVPYETRKPG